MTQTEIYQEMLEAFRTSTGYALQDTGDLAVRLQAAAAQIMGLYHYGDYILRQAFPQTAQEEKLDLQGELRGISRRTEQRATGVLRFSVTDSPTSPVGISQGTICLSDQGTAYETLEDGIILTGHVHVDIPAQAVETGSRGNTAAGTILRMQTPPDGVEAVTNPERFSGGRDRETDEAYRSRILEAYKGLNNGANRAYYKELALSVEGIDGATVVPRINGAGSVGLLVTANSGKVTSGAMQRLNELLEQRRELGIEVVVREPENVAVNVAGTILPAEGVSIAQAKGAVTKAIADYVGGLGLGKSLYLAGVMHSAMATGAVENIAITSPNADVVPAAGQQLVMGTVTLEGT